MRRHLHHERHGTANVWRSPSTARTRTIGTKCFCFVFVFCFFSFTVVLNKDENEPNNTSCPTDTLLHPRRKTSCHDHLQQILNTSNMEIIHHLVVLATNHFCVMHQININRPSAQFCVCMCALPSHCSERLVVDIPAEATQEEGHSGFLHLHLTGLTVVLIQQGCSCFFARRSSSLIFVHERYK